MTAQGQRGGRFREEAAALDKVIGALDHRHIDLRTARTRCGGCRYRAVLVAVCMYTGPVAEGEGCTSVPARECVRACVPEERPCPPPPSLLFAGSVASMSCACDGACFVAEVGEKAGSRST